MDARALRVDVGSVWRSHPSLNKTPPMSGNTHVTLAAPFLIASTETLPDLLADSRTCSWARYGSVSGIGGVVRAPSSWSLPIV
jgi:hypothetical protein